MKVFNFVENVYYDTFMRCWIIGIREKRSHYKKDIFECDSRTPPACDLWLSAIDAFEKILEITQIIVAYARAVDVFVMFCVKRIIIRNISARRRYREILLHTKNEMDQQSFVWTVW